MGTRAGRGRGKSLSHLVSEVSRPLPSLVPADPSQPLLPHKPVFCPPQPLLSLLPSTPVWPGALTWLGSSSGEGPSSQPIPRAEFWGDGAGGNKGEGQRGERAGS